MPRLSQPKDPDNTQLIVARELLKIHAERRVEVKLHDAYLTRLLYSYGIPVEEIASAYQTGPRTIYDLIKRGDK